MEWRTIPGDDAERDVERLKAYVAAHIEPAMHAVDPATGFSFEMHQRDARHGDRCRTTH